MTAVDDRASQIADSSSSDGRASGGTASDGLDPLSDVLRQVRLTGALFFVWEISSPAATSVPRGERFARHLLPDSRRIVSYHFVVEGSCWGGLVGEEPLRLEAGDILLVPGGAAYAMATSAAACRATRVEEEAALAFFREMAKRESRPIVRDGGGGPEHARIVCGFLGSDVRPFDPIVRSLPAVLRLEPRTGDGPDRLAVLADCVVSEIEDPGPGTEGVLLRLGELMYVEGLRRSLDATERGSCGWLSGLRDTVVGRCLALMHRYPERPWTLADLAAAAGASRSALAQRFAERIGETPIRYLNRWRLQIASRLLEEDRALTVDAVAHRVGYGSGPAFSRAFQRELGVSPTEWRAGSGSRGEAPPSLPGA